MKIIVAQNMSDGHDEARIRGLQRTEYIYMSNPGAARGVDADEIIITPKAIYNERFNELRAAAYESLRPR